MRIPPLEMKFMLESNPLKSRILVWRLDIAGDGYRPVRRRPGVLRDARGRCSGAPLKIP